MKRLLAVLATLTLAPMALAQSAPAAKVPPPVQFLLGPRHAVAVPVRESSAYTSGGNIVVVQPAPDTLVVTMSGSVAAIRHFLCDSLAALNFELTQAFEIVAQPGIDGVELQMEGRLIGLLRSQCHHCCASGSGAGVSVPGHAAVSCGPSELLALTVAPANITAGGNLAVNTREGPVAVPVIPGKYTLHQVFAISASHPKSLHLCRSVSADFGPLPVPTEWVGREDPFRGFAREGFGLQIILKVVPR